MDRTNMVSLFDTGSWLGGKTPKIELMGDGFTTLNEDWGPSFNDKQYIHQSASSSSLDGYAFSMTPEREYLSDPMQDVVNKAFKIFPTDTDAMTYYYRYYKTEITFDDQDVGTGECIRIPVVAGPTSTGGDAGSPLTSSFELHGNGKVELGTITIAKDRTYTWAAKTA